MADFPVPVGPMKRVGTSWVRKRCRKYSWRAVSAVSMIKSLNCRQKIAILLLTNKEISYFTFTVHIHANNRAQVLIHRIPSGLLSYCATVTLTGFCFSLSLFAGTISTQLQGHICSPQPVNLIVTHLGSRTNCSIFGCQCIHPGDPMSTGLLLETVVEYGVPLWERVALKHTHKHNGTCTHKTVIKYGVLLWE